MRPLPRKSVPPRYRSSKPRLKIWVSPDEFVAVLSPRQEKYAGIGKVGTYPASQSKI
jgi:hypothetical protein